MRKIILRVVITTSSKVRQSNHFLHLLPRPLLPLRHPLLPLHLLPRIQILLELALLPFSVSSGEVVQDSKFKADVFRVNVGNSSSSLITAGRAELRRTHLEQGLVKGISKASCIGYRFATQCYGAQLRWKG